MKKGFFILALCICAALQVCAQSGREKAEALYQQSTFFLDNEDFAKAIPLLQQSMAADPTFADAPLTLASIYAQQKKFALAIPLYQSAFAIDSARTFWGRMPYAAALASEGKFAEALYSIELVLSAASLPQKTRVQAEQRRANYAFAVDYASKLDNNYRFTPTNLGDSINSEESEYYPALNINDSLLLFTRRMQGRSESFFQATKPVQNLQYGKARPIPGALNYEPYKGAINLSQDGEWMAFAGDFGPKGLGNFDIWFSRMKANGEWDEPLNAGRGVNTEYYETAPALSPDRQTLYFTSTRPGGYGGSDIWRSRLQNGRWMEAENLGPQINTVGDEQSPFVHADGAHLYFSSNRLPGYGDHDLFVATPDSTGQFGNPQNLGYPINTTQHEGSLFVSADGAVAYYASNRPDSRGGLDLYRFALPRRAASSPTTYLRGRITDAETGLGLNGEVVLTHTASQKVQSSVPADAQGWFFVTVPAGERYNFTVSRKGYWFYSDTSTVSMQAQSQKNIALKPLKAGSSLALRQIYFETGSAALQPESLIELNNIRTILTQNPTLQLEIQGHTDNTGQAQANVQLSQQRAAAVGRWLVAQGIDQQRLRAKGYGSTQPVAENKTPEGKARNRRTELKITRL